MTINAIKMYFDECSNDKNLELKNSNNTQNIAVNKQEINKLYVRTYRVRHMSWYGISNECGTKMTEATPTKLFTAICHGLWQLF